MFPPYKRPRKRQRPGEDEFDMVLNNAEDVTPSVITQKLPPIPLESIPQSERLSLLRCGSIAQLQKNFFVQHRSKKRPRADKNVLSGEVPRSRWQMGS